MAQKAKGDLQNAPVPEGRLWLFVQNGIYISTIPNIRNMAIMNHAIFINFFTFGSQSIPLEIGNYAIQYTHFPS